MNFVAGESSLGKLGCKTPAISYDICIDSGSKPHCGVTNQISFYKHSPAQRQSVDLETTNEFTVTV